MPNPFKLKLSDIKIDPEQMKAFNERLQEETTCPQCKGNYTSYPIGTRQMCNYCEEGRVSKLKAHIYEHFPRSRYPQSSD